MHNQFGIKYYTISQAAKTVGVSKATLRRWEKQKKITSTTDENGIHLYAEKDLAPLRSLPTVPVKLTEASAKEMLPVSRAARKMGVSPSTLLRWEKAGLVTSTRTVGGARRYDQNILSGLQSRALYQRVLGKQEGKPNSLIQPISGTLEPSSMPAAIDTEAVSK